MDKKIKTLTLTDEFRVCPACGYQDGFHSMLKQKELAIQWLFICPSCHQIFDIGMTVQAP